MNQLTTKLYYKKLKYITLRTSNFKVYLEINISQIFHNAIQINYKFNFIVYKYISYLILYIFIYNLRISFPAAFI